MAVCVCVETGACIDKYKKLNKRNLCVYIINESFTSLLRTSSGTLRVILQRARVDECEKMTGARLASSA